MKSVYTFFLFFFLIINSSIFGQNCFQKLYKDYSSFNTINNFFDNTFIVSGNVSDYVYHISILDSSLNPIFTKITHNFLVYKLVKQTNDKYYGLGAFVSNDTDISVFFSLDKDLNFVALRSYYFVGGELQDIKVLNDNKFVICSQSTHTGIGWKVALVDTLGNTIWNKSVGGNFSKNSQPFVSITNHNEIILSGTSRIFDLQAQNYNENIGVVKLDTLGNIIWGYDFGTEQQESTSRNIVSSDGFIYIVSRGISTSTNLTKMAPFVTKLDLNGNEVWSKEFLFPDDTHSINIYEDADSNLVLFSNIYYRNSPYSKTKPLSFCIDRNGNPIWAYTYGNSLPEFDPSSILTGIIDANGYNLSSGIKWYGPVSTNDFGAIIIKADRLGRTYCDDTLVNFSSSNINFNWTPIDSSSTSSFTEVSTSINSFQQFTSRVEELCSGDTTNYTLKAPKIDNSKIAISIYPNPVNKSINITCKECSLKDNLEIYNSFGQLVYKTNYSSTIDVSNFKSGIYYLRIINNVKEVNNFKIIKQ